MSFGAKKILNTVGLTRQTPLFSTLKQNYFLFVRKNTFNDAPSNYFPCKH